MRSGQDSNSDIMGGKRVCYHCTIVAPYIVEMTSCFVNDKCDLFQNGKRGDMICVDDVKCTDTVYNLNVCLHYVSMASGSTEVLQWP